LRGLGAAGLVAPFLGLARPARGAEPPKRLILFHSANGLEPLRLTPPSFTKQLADLLVLDGVDWPGNYAVPNDIKPLNRPLPEAAQGSAEAGMDLLHRAIALVQTGQLNDLNKLLTPAAQAALARAGGATLLRSHRDDRAEIGNSGPVANQGTMMRLDVPIKIHIPLGEREDLREGVVTLMRESASSDGWLIAEWRLVPKPYNRTTP